MYAGKLLGKNKHISIWTKQKLRLAMMFFFTFLAVPSLILISQAYSQVKWEAFYQHRVIAETLVARINQQITSVIDAESSRAFTEYAFLNVSGDKNINFLQRSPLAIFPVKSSTPGLIGYFQIDPEGNFSTPLMPYPQPKPTTLQRNYGLSDHETALRTQHQNKIYRVLRDNQLITFKPPGNRHRTTKIISEEERVIDNLTGTKRRDAISSPARQSHDDADKTKADIAEEDVSLVQYGFDNLQKKSDQPASSSPLQQGSIGRISDLKLENQFREQLAIAEARTKKDAGKYARQKQTKLDRSSRKEQSLLPAQTILPPREASTKQRSVSLDDEIKIQTLGDSEVDKVQRSISSYGTSGTSPNGTFTAQVSMFESEIDAFQMSMLDSGHLVLYRNGWRDGLRYIQGLLVDTQAFIDTIVTNNFIQSPLLQSSQLTIAYQDNVLSVLGNTEAEQYLNAVNRLQGSLLLQEKLSAPLDQLELIFSIHKLPPGPGAIVINWLGAVLLLVLSVGLLLMYRLGLSQITLAQQQQDFISAVSHELKTPLTSIRMYGEILREGWAPEDKKAGYYDFIYDESERLTRLINNVLQLSRMTGTELRLKLISIPIPQLMDTVRSKIASQVEHGGFDLDINCDLKHQNVLVDVDSFVQIFINLVDNAIKFSAGSDQKMIVIHCQALRGGIAFSVRDYGPGIEKDQMSKIFKLFYRAENEITRDTIGTGIGLALVYQLVRAMNAEIDVVNTSPGVEFKILFPLP